MTDCPVVETSLGAVRGFVLPKANAEDAKQVHLYGKIPFAKPPVGDLRFEPPQRAEKWNGILDGTQSSPTPCQDRTNMKKVTDGLVTVKVCNEDDSLLSEDCLYVNVYTPNPSKTANLPVMFWIYGGGFQMGGSTYYNGQVICGTQDVVLVTANYRVNMFGFLTLGKATKWKGNMGLMDQVMALQWTKENIKAFGGNPENVTIFGESAGAISVGLHVLSPMSRGLFHKAISHSGVAIFPSLKEEHQEVLKIMLNNLKITETEPEKIMQKLKAFSSEEIIKSLDLEKYEMFTVTFGNDFLPEHPEAILEKGDFAAVPFIIGCNNTEGYGIIAADFPPGFADGLDKKTAMEVAKGMLSLEYPPDKLEKVLHLIEDDYAAKYFPEEKQRWSKVLGSIIADTWFVVPAVQHALAHSAKGHRTYMYHMTHKTRRSFDPDYSGGMKAKPEFCEADHTDDLEYTFGMPFAEGKFNFSIKHTEEEKSMCANWMNFLGNFARTGNPNQGRNVPVEWPMYDPAGRRHLMLNTEFGVDTNLLANRQNFWLKTVENVQ